MSVEFVDDLPPVRGGGGGKWIPVLEELKARSGQWAIIGVKASSSLAHSTALNLKHGRVQRPSGKFEFATRRVDGEHRVYGRYIGPEQ